MNLQLRQWLLLSVALTLPPCAHGHEAETNGTGLAREFAARCLSDTNVFVFNPPADLNPYREMSKEAVQQIQQHPMRDGSVLFLYLDGLPAKFESRRDFKEHGLHQTWYPDGHIRSSERYENGRLLEGTYLDGSGTGLGKIENGTGRRVIFSEPLDRRSESVRGAVDYVQGVKDGVEVYYSNTERNAKSSEAHYREGKLHGVKTQWMPTGEKNAEESYKDGRQHGRSTWWHKNGQVQATCEYIEGKQVGSWLRYYETGVKAQEVSSNEYAQWYPSGQLMVRKMVGDAGRVLSGSSFDSLGDQNGSVSNGIGALIEGEDTERYGCYRLSLFKREQPLQSIFLPRPVFSYSYSSNDLHLTVGIEARDKNLNYLNMALLIPDNCHSQDKLAFAATSLQAGRSTNFGPVVIMLPESTSKWPGTIAVDVQVVVDGHSVRYQHNLSIDFPRTRATVDGPRQEKKPAPRRETPWVLGNKRAAPVVDGKAFPAYNQATDYWQLGDTAWVLYKSPSILLMSSDRGRTWRIARSDFSYRPCGLHVRAEDNVIIWGTAFATNVNRGIAYSVEVSGDGCNSWAPFRIPKVDFLLGIGGQAEVLMISAIRIPKSGLPSDKDWFELPRTVLMSQDGTNYSEVVGPSFFDIESIKAKSIAPNKKSRAFLSVSSWLDTSYGLYLAKAPDEVPVLRLHPGAAGEMVWSSNSRILALKCAGYFVAYVDTVTGESRKTGYPHENGASEKQKVALVAVDAEIRELLGANTE